MKQINLMEQLTKEKLLKEDYEKLREKNINDNEEQQKELNDLNNRQLCYDYLFPLLYDFFATRNRLIADILQAIKLNSNVIRPIFVSHSDVRDERGKMFVYQTCFNFVKEYRDFILTNKFSKQVKKELIIMAFLHSDFYDKLINLNKIGDFTQGCHISIDVLQISNNSYSKKIFQM